MLKDINEANERLKRRYVSYLRDAKGKDPKTIDKVTASLAAFERSTRWRDFGKFHIEQAKKFKRDLSVQVNERTGKPLSKGTVSATLMHVRAFFIWLADQQGFRKKVTYADADYFTPSKQDRQKAKAQQVAKGPTIEQVRLVLANMPSGTAIEKRDRALIAFTLLTGSRVSATASLKLKHVDIAEGCVHMDAREVKTKNSKTFTTWFYPVEDTIRQMFEEWVDFLLHEQRFGPDDPLFPRTLVGQGPSHCWEAQGLDRKHWSSGQQIDAIFRKAFEAAGFPPFNPHSFRNTLARYGYEVCNGDFKALKVWSQNMAHERMLTTYLGYGTVGPYEHGEVMKSLASGQKSVDDNKVRADLAALLRKLDLEDA